uniref:Uncharacterized protein n=1 Tax=Paramormyrops kingsleyae TaxID=1676925 RepID=A0A3B3RL20_9TELE
PQHHHPGPHHIAQWPYPRLCFLHLLLYNSIMLFIYPENVAARTCAPNDFHCNNSHCIPGHWQCDHDNDCGDNSDEDECPPHQCSHSEFACTDRRCIAARWRCDGDQDCFDGSDERELQATALSFVYVPQTGCDLMCDISQFQCKNGHCIPNHWHCDGDPDCIDGSDEGNCDMVRHCPLDEFQCNNTLCKPLAWRCDGEDDCGDNSDEDYEECSESAKFQCPPTRSFRCHNDRVCLSNGKRCDGINNCGDNTDELNCQRRIHLDFGYLCVFSDAPPTTPSCEKDKFLCSNGKCISKGAGKCHALVPLRLTSRWGLYGSLLVALVPLRLTASRVGASMAHC